MLLLQVQAEERRKLLLLSQPQDRDQAQGQGRGSGTSSCLLPPALSTVPSCLLPSSRPLARPELSYPPWLQGQRGDTRREPSGCEHVGGRYFLLFRALHGFMPGLPLRKNSLLHCSVPPGMQSHREGTAGSYASSPQLSPSAPAGLKPALGIAAPATATTGQRWEPGVRVWGVQDASTSLSHTTATRHVFLFPRSRSQQL